MQELYELKEMLCEELKKYGEKGDLTTGSLEVVDKLAHAVKNLDKIIEAYEEEEGYSGRYYPMYAYEGGNRGGSYEGSYRGGSYARNQRRNSMGRYSRRGYSRAGMSDKLRELMEDAPDDKTREEIRKLADKMESM